ncbi:hypothetical protein F4604DRAFT_1916769 [Suillus subluteus]|nr:hypothetical protein F4604DRAFT_1916769 [Suillus subluteus]
MPQHTSLLMAPSPSGMVRKNDLCTPYNLCSMSKSSSSSPVGSSKSLSPTLTTIINDHDMLYFELKTTCETVFRMGTLLRADELATTKRETKKASLERDHAVAACKERHEQQEVVYQAQKRQNNLDAIFVAATMTERTAVDDAILSAQTSAYGMAASLMRMKFWFKGLQMEMTVNGIMMRFCHSRKLQVQKLQPLDYRAATSMNTLGSLRELLHSHISHFLFPPAGLMFMEKPMTISGPDPGPLDQKGSGYFLKHQLAIDKVLEMVDSVSCEGYDSVRVFWKSLVHNIQAHQAYLDSFVLENWQHQKVGSVALPLEVQHQLPIVFDNTHHFDIPAALETLSMCLLSCVFIAVLLHILGSLSCRNASFLLIAMGHVVTSSIWRFCADIKDEVKDHNLLLEMLNIELDIQEYVCCPRDHSIYGPLSKGEMEQNVIPHMCPFQETPSDEPCREPLFHEPKPGEEPKPQLQYMYQPFKSWLGRLFSRPDICHNVRWSLNPLTSRMYNIWDGVVLRNLKGPNG